MTDNSCYKSKNRLKHRKGYSFANSMSFTREIGAIIDSLFVSLENKTVLPLKLHESFYTRRDAF